MDADRIDTTCCIVGGGPAGAMLGLLLARAGVDVVVLEKHADFLRDFRGDTIHASTVQVLEELGLREAFLTLPHEPVDKAQVSVSGQPLTVVDFGVLGEGRRILLMPQWDFLDFVTGAAAGYPGFHLLMESEATGLLRDDDTVVGVTARRDGRDLEVRAPLTVACDGRSSTLRAAARLPRRELGAPIDVLWFRLPRLPDDPKSVFGQAGPGQVMILLDRGDYWQCGYIIAKGGLAELRAAGIEAFRSAIGRLSPFLGADRLETLHSWDDVKLLTVQVDRLRRWHRPGLLLIGDAAHAMSPVAGVGINVAIQDAVAAANLLAGPLLDGTLTEADLAKVQRRRLPPTVVTQTAQRVIQRQVLGRVLSRSGRLQFPTRILPVVRSRPVQRVLAHLVAYGVRPEHVRSPRAVPADG
jgi:2-polyprenyl-6-methoxyphenol hydroxylase-like FAD-dependent oxidoreductase